MSKSFLQSGHSGLSDSTLNRRSFLLGIPAVAVAQVLWQAPGVLPKLFPRLSLVQRKRLGPDAREVVFTARGQSELTGPFQLRGKGNALWIESVIWEDRDGKLHSEIVRKNLPQGKAMNFPAIMHAKKITFRVASLALASSTTLVELVG
jgi:hypothetical protein